jgi:hypothetical protein
MRGKRVPKHVRTHVPRNPRRHRVRAQLLEEPDARYRAPPVVEKQRRADE